MHYQQHLNLLHKISWIFFEDAKQKKDSVILITLSSGLSGTYQNACMAKDLVEYEDIHIIDSLSATQALRLICRKKQYLLEIKVFLQKK